MMGTPAGGRARFQ